MMKLVTYNIWNSDVNYNERMDLLLTLLKEEDIDVLALQEVRDENLVEKIKKECSFQDYYWKEYPDCHEGLAILSKYPIINSCTNWDGTDMIHNSGIMNVSLKLQSCVIGVTNVHLDYKHSYNREIEIVKAIKEVEKDLEMDYNFILGDFNTYPDSVIHNYLTGKQSLFSHSTSWIDLAEVFSRRKGSKIEPTLDFYNNPRWDNQYTLDIPGRFDWILIKSPYPKESPKLCDYRLIGTERRNGVTASDHYGALCGIDFS
ncbi:endonuclease/exonuclease/phosphatase family protein [Natronospora cellulosivora (SeqCode)]